MRVADIAAIHRHRAGGQRTQATDALRQLLLTIAGNAGDAHDLPAAQTQRNIIQPHRTAIAERAHAIEHQAFVARVRRILVILEQHRPPHHHFGQFGAGRLAGGDGIDAPAIAQDRDAVADFQHLVQFMRDENQVHARHPPID